MKFLDDAARLLETIQAKLQKRALVSRPLKIIRVEIVPSTACVNCDLLVRGSTPRGTIYGSQIWSELLTQQTLADALALRKLVFRHVPDARTAELRVFRTTVSGTRELVLLGNVRRDDGDITKAASPAMQARLYGFSFVLSDSVLHALPTKHLSEAS